MNYHAQAREGFLNAVLARFAKEVGQTFLGVLESLWSGTGWNEGLSVTVSCLPSIKYPAAIGLLSAIQHQISHLTFLGHSKLNCKFQNGTSISSECED